MMHVKLRHEILLSSTLIFALLFFSFTPYSFAQYASPHAEKLKEIVDEEGFEIAEIILKESFADDVLSTEDYLEIVISLIDTEYIQLALPILDHLHSTQSIPEIKIFGSYGLVYQQLGEYEKSIEYFELGLEIDPEDTFILSHKGKSYDMVNRPEKARQTLHIALDKEPNNVGILKKLADSYLGENNVESAKYYSRILEIEPNNANAMVGLGLTYMFDNNCNSAIYYFDKASKIDISESASFAVYVLGRCLTTFDNTPENYEKAIDLFTHLIEINHSPSTSYYYRGIAWSNLDNHENAISDYSKSLSIDQDNDLKNDIHTRYAKSLAELNEFDEIISRGNSYFNNLEYAISRIYYSEQLEHEFHYNTLFNKAQSYRLDEKDRLAIDEYDKLLEINPHDSKTLSGKALSLINLDEIELAKPHMEKALEIDEKDDNAILAKALILLNEEKYFQAFTHSQKILKDDPENVTALLVAGNSQIGLEKYTEARNYYLEIYDIFPNNTNALWGIGTTYYLTEDYSKAISYYQSILEQTPDDSDVLNELGAALFENQELEMAENYFEQSLEIDPLDEYTLSNRGEVFIELSATNSTYYSLALHDFNNALEINPEHVPALVGKATVLLTTEKYDQAKQNIEFALEIDPFEPEVLETKGDLMSKLRNCDSRIYYSSALENDPKNPDELNEKLADAEFWCLDITPTVSLAVEWLGIIIGAIGIPSSIYAYKRKNKSNENSQVIQ